MRSGVGSGTGELRGCGEVLGSQAVAQKDFRCCLQWMGKSLEGSEHRKNIISLKFQQDHNRL